MLNDETWIHRNKSPPKLFINSRCGRRQWIHQKYNTVISMRKSQVRLKKEGRPSPV